MLLEHVGGAVWTLDALYLVTALGLVAQWLLNRRYIETWLGWDRRGSSFGRPVLVA